MTILDNGTRDQYTASAAQTVFTYTFEIFVKEDIKVKQNGTTLSEGTHYTVSNVGNNAGGNITLITGATSGDILTIYRDMDLNRLTDYQDSGDFLAETVDNDYDRLWAAQQQIFETASRGIRPVIDDPILNASNTELADVATRVGKVLGFSATGAIEYVSASIASGDFTDVSTTSAMAALTGIVVGTSVVQTGAFSTGNGGGGTYDAVLTSSVTPNAKDIIISVADDLISFVLRDTKDLNIAKLGATTAIDNAAIINRAIVIADVVKTTAGVFDFNTPITLKSNVDIINEGGGSWNYTDSGTTAGIIGTSLDRINFINFTVTGSGNATGFSNVELNACTNIKFIRIKSTNSGSMGLRLLTCSNVTTQNCNFSNNFFYGIEDKDGTDNRHLQNTCNSNGITTAATGTGGRAIVVWRGINVKTDGLTAKFNTEYGFRYYSETGDSTFTEDCPLTNSYFEDNIGCDILMYDESTTGDRLFRLSVSNCSIKRTTVPTLGAAMLVEGTRPRVSNVHMNHIGASPGAYTAFNMFNAEEGTIDNCSCQNVDAALSFPGTDDFTVSNFQGYGVVKAITSLVTRGISLHNCYFSHGGVGTSDEAINNTNASGLNAYDQVTFDGFHTGLRINDIAVKIYRCKSVNSTFAGIRKTTNLTSSVELSGNQWDIAFPTELSQMESSKSQFGNQTTRFTSAPVNLFWQIGDEVINSVPVAGQPKSWKCTVAGTGSGVGASATFVSTGNL